MWQSRDAFVCDKFVKERDRRKVRILEHIMFRVKRDDDRAWNYSPNDTKSRSSGTLSSSTGHCDRGNTRTGQSPNLELYLWQSQHSHRPISEPWTLSVTKATLAPANLRSLNSICDKGNTRTGQSPNLELHLWQRQHSHRPISEPRTLSRTAVPPPPPAVCVHASPSLPAPYRHVMWQTQHTYSTQCCTAGKHSMKFTVLARMCKTVHCHAGPLFTPVLQT